MFPSRALLARSVWKGPNIVPLPIYKPVPGARPQPIRTQARSATILPNFVGLTTWWDISWGNSQRRENDLRISRVRISRRGQVFSMAWRFGLGEDVRCVVYLLFLTLLSKTMKLLLGGIHCSFTAKAIERVFCGIGSMSFENEQNMCKTRFSGQYLYLEYRIIIQSRDVPSIDPYTFLITPDDL
ncbi:hypothetical protein EYC80_009560 [Monilinia laxa]|uniref:Uncharacterized protein n=1 Tax=Monilinia laxa TaxID=61186 RepID=A0A5N6JY73_MONLA|nr:hypothetical protein EYC80_009560 [Monilinia laxa]